MCVVLEFNVSLLGEMWGGGDKATFRLYGVDFYFYIFKENGEPKWIELRFICCAACYLTARPKWLTLQKWSAHKNLRVLKKKLFFFMCDALSS